MLCSVRVGPRCRPQRSKEQKTLLFGQVGENTQSLQLEEKTTDQTKVKTKSSFAGKAPDPDCEQLNRERRHTSHTWKTLEIIVPGKNLQAITAVPLCAQQCCQLPSNGSSQWLFQKKLEVARYVFMHVRKSVFPHSVRNKIKNKKTPSVLSTHVVSKPPEKVSKLVARSFSPVKSLGRVWKVARYHDKSANLATLVHREQPQ